MRKTIFIFILAIGILGAVGWRREGVSRPEIKKIVINNQEIQVEAVRTEEEMTRGLSGREKLPENQGMLFIFEKLGNYQFWMKEMRFDLDFVFIDGDKIVDLAENVAYPKESEQPQIILAKKDFDRVLEIGAGMIRKIGVKIGDTIKLGLD